MTEEHANEYPGPVMDHYRMNRVMRHRLRNLCAGVKMTIERIASTTAVANPQIGSRCDIIINELENLREFTDRMDWLFDALPAPEPLTLFELVSALRMDFARQFPFAGLEFNGPEASIVFVRGSWLRKALGELLTNAGEACGEGETVTMAWSLDDNCCKFKIVNPGEELPEDIPLLPPVPFATTKSRHDGLGLSIACRIFGHLAADWNLRQEQNQIMVAINLPDTELKYE